MNCPSVTFWVLIRIYLPLFFLAGNDSRIDFAFSGQSLVRLVTPLWPLCDSLSDPPLSPDLNWNFLKYKIYKWIYKNTTVVRPFLDPTHSYLLHYYPSNIFWYKCIYKNTTVIYPLLSRIFTTLPICLINQPFWNIEKFKINSPLSPVSPRFQKSVSIF